MLYRVGFLLLATLELSALHISSSHPLSKSGAILVDKGELHLETNAKGDALLCWISFGDNGEDELSVALKSGQGEWATQEVRFQIGLLSKTVCPAWHSMIDNEGNAYAFWQAHKLLKRTRWESDWGLDKWIEGITLSSRYQSPSVMLSDQKAVFMQYAGLTQEQKPFLVLEKSDPQGYNRSFCVLIQTQDLRSPFQTFPLPVQYRSFHAITGATFTGQHPFLACAVSETEAESAASIYAIDITNDAPYFAYEKIADTESDAFYSFHAALDGQGRKALIWMSGDQDENVNIMTKEGGIWSQKRFKTPGDVSHCSVAIDDQGNMMSVWQQHDLIQFAYKPSGEAWSSPLSINSKDANGPQVQFDQEQNFVILWNQRKTGRRVDVYATVFSRVTRQVESPVLLISAPRSHSWSPQFAFHDRGRGTVAWLEIDPMEESVTVQVADLFVR